MLELDQALANLYTRFLGKLHETIWQRIIIVQHPHFDLALSAISRLGHVRPLLH